LERGSLLSDTSNSEACQWELKGSNSLVWTTAFPSLRIKGVLDRFVDSLIEGINSDKLPELLCSDDVLCNFLNAFLAMEHFPEKVVFVADRGLFVQQDFPDPEHTSVSSRYFSALKGGIYAELFGPNSYRRPTMVSKRRPTRRHRPRLQVEY
jgi:hypothetical protein